MRVQVTLTALAIPEEGGGYSIIVPALPGCVSQSDDIEGAGDNIKEAAEGWLVATHDRNAAEALRKATEPFPGEARP